MTDLLERYLYAVGQYLPGGRRLDVLAELRANLLAEMDDAVEQRRRPLTEAEVVEVLRRHGRPVVVAARYLPQQALIGPTVFPFYWMTLKRVAPVFLAVYLVTAAVRMAVSGDVGGELERALGDFGGAALSFVTLVTMVFATMEFLNGRQGGKLLNLGTWDPRRLPRRTEMKPQSQTQTHRVADLIVSVLMTAWLLTLPRWPYLVLGPGAGYLRTLPVVLAPGWQVFYWEIVALLLVQLAVKTMAVVWGESRWQAGLKLVVDTLGVLVIAVMVEGRTYLVPAPGSGAVGEILTQSNFGIGIALKVALAVSVVKLVWDVGVLLRRSLGMGGLFAILP